MSRSLRVTLFLVGGTIFALLVRQVGVGTIVSNARSVGWLFVPILLAYGTALACNAFTWRLTLGNEPNRPSYRHLFLLTVSGTSLNFVTPMVNAGGEPFKAAALAPWFGTRKAVSSVILVRMLNILALMLTWLTALIIGLVLLPHTLTVIVALLAGIVVVGVLALLVFSGHQRGVLESLLNLLHRLPVARRLAQKIEHRREALAEMDGEISGFYHRSPRRFLQALGVEFLARGLLVLEYYLIAIGIGVEMSYVRAYLITWLTQLIQTVLFFIPYELGTKEGSLYLLFHLAGLDARAGVYTAVVSRARDLIWIGIGLALVPVIRQHPPRPALGRSVDTTAEAAR